MLGVVVVGFDLVGRFFCSNCLGFPCKEPSLKHWIASKKVKAEVILRGVDLYNIDTKTWEGKKRSLYGKIAYTPVI